MSVEQESALLAETSEVQPVELVLLLAYEDTTTGMLAKRSFDSCLLNSPGIEIKTRLWRWDLLRYLAFREQAALEASAADVILVSAHGKAPLPLEIQQWLKRWLIFKAERPYALGVLLEEHRGSRVLHNPVFEFVQHIAQAAGADFFHGFGSPLPHDLKLERAQKDSSILPNRSKRAKTIQETCKRKHTAFPSRLITPAH